MGSLRRSLRDERFIVCASLICGAMRSRNATGGCFCGEQKSLPLVDVPVIPLRHEPSRSSDQLTFKDIAA